MSYKVQVGGPQGGHWHCLFRNGELVGNRRLPLKSPFPPHPSRISLLFQVQVHPLVLTCRSFTTWAMSMGTLPPTTLLLPSSPWSQPSGLFLFVQINLCAGLCVYLGCPIHLLPLRDPFSCIGTFSHASS